LKRLVRLLPLTLLAAACTAPRVRLIPRYASLEVEGTVEIEPRSSPVNLKNDLDDLGINDPEDAFLPRVDLDWERFHVIALGYDVDWRGDGVAEADLELGNGEIITVGTPVTSEIDYSITTANFFYDFFPRLPFELGLGIGVGFLDYDVSVEDRAGSAEVSTSEELPFGCLAMRIAKPIGNFELNLFLQGVEFEYDDDEYLYWGGEAAVIYEFSSKRVGVGAMLGYSFQHVELTYTSHGTTTEAKADLSGPFVGLILTL